MVRPAVSAAMPNRRARLVATALLICATLLSGCGLISAVPGFSSPEAPGIGPGAPGGPPTIGGGAGGDPGGGAIGGGDTGIGVGVPPGGGIQLPDNPTIVVVHPGLAALREVSPVELRWMIDAANHVIVRVRWWGGIEPCEVLDSVDVVRDGATFTITARVGSAAAGQVACIEIARDTATLVDLGALASGTYTVRASAGAARPISVTVP